MTSPAPDTGQPEAAPPPPPPHAFGAVPPTVPWIREAACGKALQRRLNALSRVGLGASCGPAVGPADLLLWQRYYGTSSPVFLANPFASPAESAEKDDIRDDGYVSFHHFCNGIDYSGGAAAVDAYVMAALGLEPVPGGPQKFRWRPSAGTSSSAKNASVVTLCAYNAFARAEFRARYDIIPGRSRKDPVAVAAKYTIQNGVHERNGASHEYSRERVGAVSRAFWHELAASALIRVFVSVDEPASQACGTVNLPAQVCDRAALVAAADRLVALLPRGQGTGSPARYGKAGFCGADDVKTSRYRNLVVDALARVVALNGTGAVAQHVTRRIRALYRWEYDWAVARVLRADCSRNNQVEFLQLVAANVARAGASCQTGLLLVEQARFLLARGSCESALAVAGKAVEILPTDFEAWYYLALCYMAIGQHRRALETMNSFPSPVPADAEFDDDDTFAQCFMDRLCAGLAPIDLRTFDAFFPPPRVDSKDLGSMQRLWYDRFSYQPQMRHPTCGRFQRTPGALASPVERSTVDAAILAASGPDAPKLALAAQSGRNPWSSLLDFDARSVWGRTYDLFTCFVAIVGWDNFVRLKEHTFRAQAESSKDPDFSVDNGSRPVCKSWLAVLFRIVYDDLYLMLRVSKQEHSRSVLEWSLIGLLGWACKFNLRESVSATFTSNTGFSHSGQFDYFGTVRILQMYNEVVLSDSCPSSIDHFAGAERNYSCKWVLHSRGAESHRRFVEDVTRDHFSVETVLLCVTKLVSWNLRWYQYMPNALVCETLIKLCATHDLVFVRSQLQILAVTLLKREKKAKGHFTLKSMFAAPKEEETAAYEFVEGDTAIAYLNKMLDWIESLR